MRVLGLLASVGLLACGSSDPCCPGAVSEQHGVYVTAGVYVTECVSALTGCHWQFRSEQTCDEIRAAWRIGESQPCL